MRRTSDWRRGRRPRVAYLAGDTAPAPGTASPGVCSSLVLLQIDEPHGRAGCLCYIYSADAFRPPRRACSCAPSPSPPPPSPPLKAPASSSSRIGSSGSRDVLQRHDWHRRGDPHPQALPLLRRGLHRQGRARRRPHRRPRAGPREGRGRRPRPRPRRRRDDAHQARPQVPRRCPWCSCRPHPRLVDQCHRPQSDSPSLVRLLPSASFPLRAVVLNPIVAAAGSSRPSGPGFSSCECAQFFFHRHRQERSRGRDRGAGLAETAAKRARVPAGSGDAQIWSETANARPDLAA